MDYLKRELLFEKYPLRVKVSFNKYNISHLWYRNLYGRNFNVTTYVNNKNIILFRIINGEYESYYIYEEHCKIISGNKDIAKWNY